MPGLGTIINCAMTLLGGVIGLLFGKALKERYQHILTCACGLATMFIGIAGTMQKMLTVSGGTLESGGAMMTVICLCAGGLAGEWIRVEERLERFGETLKRRSRSEKDPRFVEGFCSASFTICIGAMAVIGPFNDAVYHDYSLLITKGILDMVIVMALSASFGKGPLFSVIPLFVFQGLMTLLAGLLAPLMTQTALDDLSLVGNMLIFCVGVNLAFGKRIKVANFLPALIAAVLWGLLA